MAHRGARVVAASPKLAVLTFEGEGLGTKGETADTLTLQQVFMNHGQQNASVNPHSTKQ